jgi:hypothetical protein
VAKKKISARQRAWLRLKSNPGSLYGLLRPNRRGRPKGETEPVEARRGMIELDFLWLEAGGVDIRNWTDLEIVNELLDPIRREKYKLGECQYRRLHKDTLRRRINAVRNKF